MGWAHVINADHEAAKEYFDRATELEPQNPEVYAWYCEALNCMGEPEQAIDAAETCLHFDPVAPANVLHHLGHANFLLGNLEMALEFESRVARTMPSFPPGRIIAASALVEIGRVEEAKDQIQAILDYNPDFRPQHFVERYPYINQEPLDRISASLSKAGLT